MLLSTSIKWDADKNQDISVFTCFFLLFLILQIIYRVNYNVADAAFIYDDARI